MASGCKHHTHGHICTEDKYKQAVILDSISEVMATAVTTATTTATDDDGDDSDYDDDDWDGFCEPEPAPTKCLFSEEIFPTAAECLSHAVQAHGVDLADIAGTLRLDIYGRVKLVNYVRGRVAAAARPLPPVLVGIQASTVRY